MSFGARMKPSLDIVIVNWNVGRHLGLCLDCIRATNRDGFDLKRVVVVDNASSDSSVDNLHFPDLPLSLLRNAENRGFAVACNQGAWASSADYLLFLNPDMRVLDDSLQIPIQFMEEPRNAGVGMCGIQLLDEERNVSRSCARFPTPGSFFSRMLGLDRLFPKQFKGHFLGQLDHLKCRQVDQVMGAFFLVRHKLFESMHGFDERFFVYFEELDFSYRAHQAGWQSYYLTTAQAYHKGGGCSEQVKGRRLYYSLCSRILYCYKQFGWAAATGVMLGTLLVEPFSRLVLAVAHKSVLEMQQILQAYTLLWRVLPSLLRNHRGNVKHKEPSPEAMGSIPAE
jgi:N-acetylglucosaminyl-diphospho-decaprenol L-rhamnosyltransferase